MSRVRSAKRVTSFADSVFGEMTRLAKLHNAVNLSQGFPDFEAPMAVKEAACAAIHQDQNQYAPPYGTRSLREAIAAAFAPRPGVPTVSDQQFLDSVAAVAGGTGLDQFEQPVNLGQQFALF